MSTGVYGGRDSGASLLIMRMTPSHSAPTRSCVQVWSAASGAARVLLAGGVVGSAPPAKLGGGGMSHASGATCVIKTPGGAGDATALRAALQSRYQEEPFVRVLPPGGAPATRHVRGSNFCILGVFADRLPGRAILVSTLDNLVKGSSGQAVQNLNLMFGLPETLGLEQAPMFP